MRGTRLTFGLPFIFKRIITADAGNTNAGKRTANKSGDHPRGCGEHVTGLWGAVAAIGSSPRMRGTLFNFIRPKNTRRIIHADAGNTRALPRCSSLREDHPRGCGEHWTVSCATAKRLGSSPRMRGTPMPSRKDNQSLRIIPADAGNT